MATTSFAVHSVETSVHSHADCGTSAEDIKSLEDAAQIQTYSRWPMVIESGKGCFVTDTDGNTFLDFYGGHCVSLLGHCHADVVLALKEQAEKLLFYSNVVYSGVRARAAALLTEMAGNGMERVFFCNSGTEANEAALKIAKKMTGRHRVIAMKGGFHGRTLGSLAVTWNPEYREPYTCSLAKTSFVRINDLEAIQGAFLDSTDVAAVILEPIQSMAGMISVDREYIHAVRKLCTLHGAQLIFDEVQTGVGRTGTFLFSEQLGIQPDLTTLAKSLASGLPAGAVLMTDSVAATVSSGDQGTTFGGGMLAMAAMNATLTALVSGGGLSRAGRIFEMIQDGLAGEEIEVCGAGCLIGLRFDRPVASLCDALRIRNVLVGGSADPNVMRLMPPVTAADDDVEKFLAELTSLLRTAGNETAQELAQPVLI